MKKTFLICLFAFLAIFVVFSSAGLLSIYSGVKKVCLQPKQDFKEDCVGSLINFAKSEKYFLRERNSAIWA